MAPLRLLLLISLHLLVAADLYDGERLAVHFIN